MQAYAETLLNQVKNIYIFICEILMIMSALQPYPKISKTPYVKKQKKMSKTEINFLYCKSFVSHSSYTFSCAFTDLF